jgi:hypothetical protein
MPTWPMFLCLMLGGSLLKQEPKPALRLIAWFVVRRQIEANIPEVIINR